MRFSTLPNPYFSQFPDDRIRIRNTVTYKVLPLKIQNKFIKFNMLPARDRPRSY